MCILLCWHCVNSQKDAAGSHSSVSSYVLLRNSEWYEAWWNMVFHCDTVQIYSSEIQAEEK